MNNSLLINDPWDLIKECSSSLEAEEAIEKYLLDNPNVNYAYWLLDKTRQRDLQNELKYSAKDILTLAKKESVTIENIDNLPRWVWGFGKKAAQDRITALNINNIILELQNTK